MPKNSHTWIIILLFLLRLDEKNKQTNKQKQKKSTYRPSQFSGQKGTPTFYFFRPYQPFNIFGHTCDLNKCAVQCHLRFNDLWVKFLKRVTISTYFDVFSWDLDTIHNNPLVESPMWPQQTWGQRLSRGQWVKSNITMIAKVCDRKSRWDSWFENRLVNIFCWKMSNTPVFIIFIFFV